MTHLCPGLCGRHLGGVIFACPGCTRLLPDALRTALHTSFWAGDWVRHSRAMTDCLHWLAQQRRGGTVHTGGSGEAS